VAHIVTKPARSTVSSRCPGAALDAGPQHVWSWDHDTSGLFRDIDPLRWSQLNHSPVSLLNEYPLEKLEARAANSSCIAGSTMPIAACASNQDASEPGVRATPRAAASPWLFLRNSACMNLSGLFRWTWSSGWRSHQERLRSRHPSHRRGLFYGQGYFRQRLDRDGWQHEEYLDRCQPTCHGNGRSGPTADRRSASRNPPWAIHAKVWRVKVGRCELFLSTPMWKEMLRKTAS